jgi:integrase
MELFCGNEKGASMSEAGAAVAVAVEMKKEKRSRGSGRIWKRGAFLWVQFYDQHGRQRRESSHSAVLQVAERLLKRRTGESAAGLLLDPKSNRVSVDDLAQSFLLDYRNNGKSIRWANDCWDDLKPFFGGMKAAHVTTDDIQKYVEKRKGDGVSNATVNRELSCLRRMFAIGMQCTPPKVQRIPIFPARLKEANPRSGFVEDALYRKLCENCKEPWLRAFLAVAYTFGFRREELLKLKARQVDLLDRTIRLDPGTTKNKEGRMVKMTEEVYLHLVECVRGKGPEDRVFTWHDGREVRDFRGLWTKITEAAGLSGLLIHDLRRSAVRNMVRNGIPEVVCMRISGHKTRSVFDRYNIVSETDLADAARKIEQGRAQNRDASENGDNTGTVPVQQVVRM